MKIERSKAFEEFVQKRCEEIYTEDESLYNEQMVIYKRIKEFLTDDMQLLLCKYDDLALNQLENTKIKMYALGFNDCKNYQSQFDTALTPYKTLKHQ